MERYSQLTSDERYQIHAVLKAGHTMRLSAEVVGKHKSTISRKIARNTGERDYRPKQAQRLCDQRKQARPSQKLFDPALWGAKRHNQYSHPQ